MSQHGLALFCLVYLLATATPGPGIAAILARVLSHGTAGLAGFIGGFVVGDLIWFTLAATGMAVLAQTAHAAFAFVKYAGAAYLLYLALRLWMAPAHAPALSAAPAPGAASQGSGAAAVGAARSGRMLLAGVTLTLGNPKVMVFYLALLPTVLDLSHIAALQALEVGVAICIILSTVLACYALAAMRVRHLFRSASSVRWLNRGSGTVMAGAALAVATR